jgi:hypothetical protein
MLVAESLRSQAGFRIITHRRCHSLGTCSIISRPLMNDPGPEWDPSRDAFKSCVWPHGASAGRLNLAFVRLVEASFSTRLNLAKDAISRMENVTLC